MYPNIKILAAIETINISEGAPKNHIMDRFFVRVGQVSVRDGFGPPDSVPWHAHKRQTKNRQQIKPIRVCERNNIGYDPLVF